MPIVLIDTMTALGCVACDDPATVGGPLCTSCHRWDTHGTLPTTVASCRAALDVLADGVGTVEGDVLLQVLSNRLLVLEDCRAHSLPGQL